MTANTENIKAREAIKRKSIRNEQNRTFQTHHISNLIFPMTAIIKARNTIKNKKYQKRTPIKLCAKLMEKLLAKAYEYNKIKFKLDEDMIHVIDLDYTRLMRQVLTTNP